MNKEVCLVINIPKAKRNYAEDRKTIRKMCLKNKVTYITTLAGALAALKGIESVKHFKKEAIKFKENNIKVLISGRKEKLNQDVLGAIEYIQNETKNNTGGILNICLNYGGQEEIIDASKKIAIDYKKGILNLDELNKKTFYK